MKRPVTRKNHVQTAERRPQPADSPSMVDLQLTASHETLRSVPHEQAYYLLLQPTPTADMTAARMPINLCLLVDRSTSMRGERLHQVKIAINRIIDKLQPNDTLSVVAFSDRAEVVLPGQRRVDMARIRSVVSTIQPSGGTEIAPGLETSLAEIKRNRSETTLDHLILLTDGHTYGDEADCLGQAEWAGQHQIHFSAIGLGHDWNETFLDEMVSLSGGTAIYIDRPDKVENIFDETMQNLETAVARELTLQLDLHPKIELHEIHQILPHINKIEAQAGQAKLGLLSADQEKSILLEFRVQRLPTGPQQLMRVTLEADIPYQTTGRSWEWADVAVQVTETPALNVGVPTPVKVALKKLAVFKMQSQIDEDLKAGDIKRATQRLQIMATRLLDLGQNGLAQAALQEAKQLAHTGTLSAAGGKRIRYGTRRLSI